MTVQFADDVRDARNDAIETVLGVSPVLKLRTGAQPANAAAADSGTVIATINLPADWMTNSAAGVKSKSGTWEDTAADNTGSLVNGHYRIYTSGGVCKLQGSVTATGGGGDMTVNNTAVTAGQDILITSYSWTDGNP